MSGLQPPDGTKEIIEGVTEAIKQRLGSPLLFAYIASWCFFNYKFLLVIFAEDPFKVKFEYIANSIQIFFWPPLIAAVVISMLIPISEIPYRAFKAYCKNIEVWAEMLIHRRTPMDTHEQAAAFGVRDKEISDLRLRINNYHHRMHENESISFERTQKLNSQLRALAIRYMNQTSLSDAQFISSLKGNDENEGNKQIVVNGMRKHNMLAPINDSLRAINDLDKLPDGACEVDTKQLFDKLVLTQNEFAILLEILFAFEILSKPTLRGDGFAISRTKSNSFKNAVSIINAALRDPDPLNLEME